MKSTKKQTKIPKSIYMVVPLDDDEQLDFSERYMESTDTLKGAEHIFADEKAERRPAAIVEIDTSTLKILKTHNKNKYSCDCDD